MRLRLPPPAAPAGVPVPVARKEPKQLKASPSFSDAPPRVDNYAWMRDDGRNNSAVLSHLQASKPGGACGPPNHRWASLSCWAPAPDCPY